MGVFVILISNVYPRLVNSQGFNEWKVTHHCTVVIQLLVSKFCLFGDCPFSFARVFVCCLSVSQPVSFHLFLLFVLSLSLLVYLFVCLSACCLFVFVVSICLFHCQVVSFPVCLFVCLYFLFICICMQFCLFSCLFICCGVCLFHSQVLTLFFLFVGICMQSCLFVSVCLFLVLSFIVLLGRRFVFCLFVFVCSLVYLFLSVCLLHCQVVSLYFLFVCLFVFVCCLFTLCVSVCLFVCCLCLCGLS